MSYTLPEPAAHMFSDDLEKFRENETFAHSYSVAVGSPGQTEPMFTVAQMQAAYEAGLAALEAQEPVAHQFQDTDGTWCNFIDEKHRLDTAADGRWPIRKLYLAAGAASVPMSNDDITALWPNEYWDEYNGSPDAMAFARAIEAHHKIGKP